MIDRHRNYHHVAPSTGDGLKLGVKTEGGRLMMGEVTDLALESADAVFPLAQPPIELGSQVKLSFRTPKVCIQLKATGQVISRVDAEETRRYGFRFTDCEHLGDQVGRRLQYLFNKRGMVRIAVEGTPAALCAFEGDLRGRDAMVKGQLLDVSGSGAGVLLHGHDEGPLANVQQIGIRFRLPGAKSIVQFTAWIRSRRVREAGILYGIEFCPDQTKGFRSLQEQVIAFVVERQRAI